MKRNIFLFVTLFAAIFAAAQTATVKSFAPSFNDLTAQKYSRLDKNGVKCAVVKVQVIADNVQFRGGIIEPVDRQPGEYWVYMPGQEQRVQVLSDDFKPLMVEFPEPLQAGVTYVLDIEAPQRESGQPQKPKMSFLVLKVEPADATAIVRIDGVAMAGENGVVSKMLANGEHRYSVEAPGYASEEGTVTLDGHRMERTITLRSTKPTLTVTAATPGTEIYVNESLKGTGSWSGELFADSYMVEGRKTGYRPVSEMVTLAEGEKCTVSLPELTAITGSLSVDYKPVGAKITIDGTEAGITPDLINDLLVGPHTVAISADGYETATLTAQVTEGETVSLTGSLSTTPATEEDSAMKYFFGSGQKTENEAENNGKYDTVRKFSEGLALVKKNGKYGFIDESGTMRIPVKYDYAEDFSEGLALVRRDGKYSFVDKSGNMIAPAKYQYAMSFREGLAPVRLNGKSGFIDKRGNEVIAMKYDDAIPFSEGLAKVKLNDKYGYIDKSGNMVIPAKFDNAFNFSGGKSEVSLGGRWFYIDRNGNEVK